MAAVQFTARRRMLPGRISGDFVTLELNLSEASRAIDVKKYPHQAIGGALETIIESVDIVWTLKFGPAIGRNDIARLIEFVESISSGELFKCWIYGTETAPLSLRRTDEGYAREILIPTGLVTADPISATITAIEST